MAETGSDIQGAGEDLADMATGDEE
jgi:hypothetical protein